MASACRKFISRYLVSSRKDTDYNEDTDLSVNLTRYEFWPNEIIDDEDNFINEISLLKNAKLSTGQCFELYNLIGGDENDELKDIKLNKDEEKEKDEDEGEDNDSDYDEEERIARRNKKEGRKRGKGYI